MLKKASAGALALLIAAPVVVWFADFDATEIGRAALAEASASSGLSLEASSYRINLLRGVELENVEASSRVPGARYEVAMPLMRFAHRLSSLLSGPLEIERVVLVEPRVLIVTGLDVDPAPRPRRRSPGGSASAAPTEPTAPVAAPPSPVALGVRELELSGGAVTFNDALSLDGVDIVLESPRVLSGRLTLLHAIDARGRLAIRELSFRTLAVRNIVVNELDLAGGRVELGGGRFEVDRGRFRADVELDLNTIPARYRMTLEGELHGIPGRVSFQGEGFSLDARNLKGRGEWRVPAGWFDDAPLWRRLDLTGSAYEATELTFDVADGALELDGVWIRGTVGLDGQLDLMVSGREVGGTWDAPVVR